MIRESAALLTLALLLAACTTEAAGDGDAGKVLVRDGVGACPIILGPNASESEKWAARELVDHIRQMTGVTLDVQTTDAAPSGAILLGLSPAVRSLVGDIDGAALGTDGYVIRTVNDRLIIAGGRKRGTLYGVYALLESLGVRWWSPTETFIPKMSTVIVPPTRIRQTPALEYRDMMYGELFSPEGRLWAARNKVNGMAWQDTEEKLGGRYEFVGNLVHSYMGLLGDSGVEITPDMLALYKGKRTGTQPCLTHPKVLEAITASVIAKFKANPNARFVVVGQNDNGGYCRCDACQAIATHEESQAGPVIHFANQVAERVGEQIPGARICTAAYEWSRKPPRHVRPRKNVHVTLCSIECDFSRPFAAGAGEVNRAFREDIIGWSKITDKLFIWDYTTNFRHFLAPHPNLDVLTANVKFFADHGAAGVFEQGAHTCVASEFAALRMWLLAKSLWNPDADGQALIDEFVTGFYGPAAAAIKEYIAITHAPVRAKSQVMGCFMNLNAAYLDGETMAKAQAATLRGAHLAGDAEPYARRVRHAGMPIEYVMLKRGPNSPTWRTVEATAGPQSHEAIAQRFMRTAAEWKINSIAERNALAPWLDWLETYPALATAGRATPPELEGVDPGAYRLIQACQMDTMGRWYIPVNTPPNAASDGWAVQCDTNAWLLRHSFRANDEFEPGKRYTLFVRVRRGDGSDGPAWSCGVRTSGDHLVLRVGAEQMSDDQWRVHEVGQWTPADGDYFYLALQENNSAKSVYLDCMWLIESPSP